MVSKIYPNFFQERRLWKNGWKYVVGLDEAGRGCERPDAEVLTNNGWKFYFDITPEDKVLSYTNDGYLRWQKIEKVIEKDFEGNLIEFKNRGIHIVVTPGHYFTVLRRVFKRDKKDNNRLKLIGYKAREERRVATDLLDNDFIPRGGKWKAINKKFFKLPEVDRNRRKLIDIKLWVAFLGIFLSEGSISYNKKKGSYVVFISQSKNSPYYEKIHSLLKRLPFRFSKFENGFRCLDKQLYLYLKQFGDCYTKFIPKEIKELPPDLLNILIDWMILGDGSCYTGKNRKQVCIYYTVSKRLKDDFEEILLKAGWTYHTNIRKPKDRWIAGRIIKKENQVPCFEIRLRKSNKVTVKHLHKRKIFYKGKVFCLQLLKHHNFYVRRNGTGYFTGNSLAGPVVAAAVMIKSRISTNTTTNITNDYSRKFVPKFVNIREIKDSKKLSPKKREEIYQLTKNCSFIKWGIGKAGPAVIDKINILEATKLAMGRAVENLEKNLNRREIDFLIIDGNFGLDLPIAQKSIIRGDEKVFSISLASIIAKVVRDKIMEKYHQKYPRYGFDRHKGYPTKEHLEKLKKYNPCPIHRKSFQPVEALDKQL